MNAQQIKDFILAGNALFTLKSLRTGEHYTFKVVRQGRWLGEKWVAAEPKSWQVQVLNGPDNSRNYRRIGTLRSDGNFYGGLAHCDSFSGFAWCWNHLDRAGERFEFQHAGRCGRCGRLLTHPESIQSGIGPECQERMAFEAAGGVDGLMNQLFGG